MTESGSMRAGSELRLRKVPESPGQLFAGVPSARFHTACEVNPGVRAERDTWRT